MSFEKKYLKYKNKYMSLKYQTGGLYKMEQLPQTLKN
jgi:hypothetical protein